MDSRLKTSLDCQIQKFRKILEENPRDLSVMMAFAEANFRRGNRLEAMKAYQDLIREKPHVPDIRIALAKIYFSMGHYHDAAGEVVNIFRQDARNLEAHLLFEKIMKVSEISEEFSNAIEEHRNFTVTTGRLKSLKIQYELEKNKFEHLIGDYNRQLQYDPGNPIITYNRSKAEERVKSAMEFLEILNSLEGVDEEEINVPADIDDAVSTPEESLENEEAEELIEDAGIEEEHKTNEISIQDDESLSAADLSGMIPDPESETPSFMEIDVAENRENKNEAEPIKAGALSFLKISDDMPDLSGKRTAFYLENEDKINEILDEISRTRCVTCSLVMDNSGHIIQNISTESFDPRMLGAQILRGAKPLTSWKSDDGNRAKDLSFWALEFKNGLMVLHPLHSSVYLAVLGRAGLNFGAVKHCIEKNVPDLACVFAEIPE